MCSCGAINIALFKHPPITTQELGVRLKPETDTKRGIIRVYKGDSIGQHIHRKVLDLLTLPSCDRSMNRNKLLYFIRTIVIRFALELVKQHCGSITKKMGNTLDLIGLIQCDCIAARLRFIVGRALKEQFIVHALAHRLARHEIIREEQRAKDRSLVPS